MGQAWGASWFPDGRRIAYSVEDRLIVRDLESGVSRVYPTPVAGRLVRTPAVSPDGQRIVFQVYRDGAWVLDLRTGSLGRLLCGCIRGGVRLVAGRAPRGLPQRPRR